MGDDEYDEEDEEGAYAGRAKEEEYDFM